MKYLLPVILLICFAARPLGSPETNKMAGPLAAVSVPGVPSLPKDNSNGIVFFSYDHGATWENKSAGLPQDFNLTDLAVADSLLLLSTKQNGIFRFNFGKNLWQHTDLAPPTTSNLDVVNFYQGNIFVGSQNDGLFSSRDLGKSWAKYNAGLQNATIRRITVLENKLWLGTNAGLYVLNEQTDQWTLVFGNPTLQVNGIAESAGELYIGTNQGIFKSSRPWTDWKAVLTGRSAHNLSADDQAVYAMIYNELYLSDDQGQHWRSMQAGLPDHLYTFQLRSQDGKLFAGQWDGVYCWNGDGPWARSSTGLPEKFATTELIFCGNILVAATSTRRQTGSGQ